MKLSVIGLGKLGSCSAACFAYRGYEVIGVDLNKNFVDAINNCKAPVIEPRLQDLISASNGRLKATKDFKFAIENSDVTFLIVPTPSMENGHFTDKYLKDALKELALGLKDSSKQNHIFVITSTVSPGTTEKSIIPFIEEISGRKLNEGFEVCYNPEFIALGSIINNFLNPDMLLIGESSKHAGDIVSSIYEKTCENKPYYARMSLVSAEISKISLNSYVTMKISFANTLANICEKIPGSNIDDITKALGADKRISPYYLKGGLGYGGPCFPRDNRAFAAFASVYDIDAFLAKATDKVNQLQVEHLLDLVMDNVSKEDDRHIAILGLAYKPDTPVIEESAVIKLIDKLVQNGYKVKVYDPLAIENTREYFGDKIQYSSSAKECVNNASVCIITTQAAEFKKLNLQDFPDQITIIDCWRILQKDGFQNGRNVISLGVCK